MPHQSVIGRFAIGSKSCSPSGGERELCSQDAVAAFLQQRLWEGTHGTWSCSDSGGSKTKRSLPTAHSQKLSSCEFTWSAQSNGVGGKRRRSSCVDYSGCHYNYLTKYMGKLGTGHTATSRIGRLLDDILCRMQDHDTMTVTSLLSKLFIHTAVPDQICSLEAWHILHDFPRVLSSRFFVNLNAKEHLKLKQLETIQAGAEETTVTRQTKCDIYAKRLENHEFGEKLNAEKVRKMSWAQFVARVDRRGKKFSLRKKQAIVKEKPYLNLDSKRPNAGDMARYALRLHRSFGSSTADPLALSDTDAVEQLHSFVESALCPMWLKQRFRRQNKVKKVKKVVASIAPANAESGDGGDVALLPVSAGNAQQASDVTLPSVGASNDSTTSKKKNCRA